MARVKLSTEQAQALRSRPVAKRKDAVRSREAMRELERNAPAPKVKVSKDQQPPVSTVGAQELRAVMADSMARVYGEIYSGMTTHDEDGVPDREIQEEVYIVALSMMFGNDVDLPRQALAIREDGKASEHMKSCPTCQRKEDSNGKE